MSLFELLRQTVNRQGRDSTSAEIPNLDLNVPPAESWLPDGVSGSSYPFVSQGAIIPFNHQHVHSTREHRGVVPPASIALTNSPIDVDAIKNDAEMISALRGFPQTRCQAWRNQPVMVVLDEDLEPNPRRPVLSVGEQVTTFSLNTFNKRARIPTSMVMINCDHYLDLDQGNNAKKRAVMKSDPEPEKVVAKEPTFTCPICLNAMVEASSTICGHMFCHSCIKASIKAQKKCPACRRKLTMNNFHRVYLPAST